MSERTRDIPTCETYFPWRKYLVPKVLSLNFLKSCIKGVHISHQCKRKNNYLNPDILMCLDNLKSTFNTMIISSKRHLDHLNSPILMPRVPKKPQFWIFSARCKRRPAPCLLDFGRPWLSAWLCLTFFWGFCPPPRHPMANRQFPMKYAIWEVYPLVNVYITMENHHAINGKTHYFNGHFQ